MMSDVMMDVTTAVSSSTSNSSNGTTSENFDHYWLLVQVHIVAMCNLSTSIIISVAVIVHIIRKHRNIFKRPIGERLVFYLAWGDLCFSISHMTDHIVVLYKDNEPPVTICRVLGFFMTTYFNSPCVVVVVTAINAFVMVVLTKKLDLGRYDWKLLVGAFVAPQVLGIFFAFLGLVGWNGVWCGYDYSTPVGVLIAQINALFNTAIFIITLICYAFIWWKIRSVGKQISGDSSGKAAESAAKYHKSARVMMIFVISYVLQYWAITIYYTWQFFGDPHVFIVFATVTFTNQGGLFNFFAYTYVRKKYSSTGGGGGGESTTTGGTSVVENTSRIG